MIRRDPTLAVLVIALLGCGGATPRQPTTPASTEVVAEGPRLRPLGDSLLLLADEPGPATATRASALGLRVERSSSASTSSETLATDIERALASYRDFEFAAALEALDRIDAELARGAPSRAEIAIAVRAQVLRAANELALQHEPAASNALRIAAALLRPTDSPPGDTSPELRTRLDAARAEVAALAPATLHIGVRPSDARVVVDGGNAALTASGEPTTLTLAPGRHFVHVERTGSEPYATAIDFAAGGERSLTVELAPVAQPTARSQVLARSPAELRALAPADRAALAAALSANEIWRVDAQGGRVDVHVVPLGDGAPRHAFAVDASGDLDAATARALADLARAPPLATPTRTPRAPRDTPSESSSVLESPWLWMAVGAVVVAGATTTAVIVTAPPDRRGILSIE